MNGVPPLPAADVRRSYFFRWQQLSRPARLYLVHIALLTASLAIVGLFYNLALLALGFSLDFLGLLNTVSFASATALGVPLLWLVARVRLRLALLASAGLQLASTLLFVLWPVAPVLLLASALAGVAAVLFQVSAAPFMMRHSDAAARDHLFSANTAIAIGLAGLGSLVAGQLPRWFAGWLHVGSESALAYRAAFAVASVGLLLALVPLLALGEDRRPATDDRRPTHATTDDRRPTTDDRRPTTDENPRRLNRSEFETRVHSDAEGLATEATKATRATTRMIARLPQEWRALARHPGLLLQLLISPALISIGAALLIPYLNLFFKQRFAVSDGQLGLIFAAFGLATALAALMGPAISLRLGKIRTVVLTQALALPLLLVMGFVPMFGVVVGAALARAALFNMAAPLYDAFAMERADDSSRPALIGLIGGASSIGYAVAPLMSTQIQATYGFAPIFIITAICYTLAVLAKYWFFIRLEKPDEH